MKLDNDREGDWDDIQGGNLNDELGYTIFWITVLSWIRRILYKFFLTFFNILY